MLRVSIIICFVWHFYSQTFCAIPNSTSETVIWLVLRSLPKLPSTAFLKLTTCKYFYFNRILSGYLPFFVENVSNVRSSSVWKAKSVRAIHEYKTRAQNGSRCIIGQSSIHFCKLFTNVKISHSGTLVGFYLSKVTKALAYTENLI